MSQPEVHESNEVIGSQVLARLPKERRPNPSTTCEICPWSNWLVMTKEVKCYCRLMYLWSWTSNDTAKVVKQCDGPLMAAPR